MSFESRSLAVKVQGTIMDLAGQHQSLCDMAEMQVI